MLRIAIFILSLWFVAGCNSRLSVPCAATGECIDVRAPASSANGLADITLAVSGSLLATTVGTTRSSTVTATNAGQAPATSVVVVALSAPYSIAANTCGSTLAAGASCTFDVRFSPLSVGTPAAAQPKVNYFDGESAQVGLTSVAASAGSPVLTLTASGPFPSTAVGANNSISFTLDNATAYDASSVSVAALSSPYSVTSNSCGATLVGGASCSYSVLFSPLSAGTANDATSVSYNDGVTTTSVNQPLAGSGYVSAYAVLGLSASGSFPLTTVGSTNTVTITVSNGTGLTASSVSVGAVSVPFSIASNTCGATIVGGASCTFDVVFSPTSAGTSSQTISVSYFDGNATQSSSVGLSGTGGVSTLTLTPSGAFPTIIAGSSSSVTITVNNATSYTASSVSVAALGAPFSVGSNTCGATVAPGANCTFVVTFAPTAAGTFPATATVNYSNGASATSATQSLSGTAGVSSLSLSASGAFPNTTAGASSPITITVSNPSSFSATSVSVAALSAPFAVSSNLCAATIVAGGSCTFVVTFSPTSAGTFPDTATVNYSNGAGGTMATLGLSATGGISTLSLSASGSFSNIIAGSTESITITATNSSSYLASSVSVPAMSAPFSVGANTCTSSVAAGGTCTYTITFSPTAAGTFPDTATVNYSNGATSTSATLAISATAGVATLSLAASGAFPSTPIGSTNSITITASNASSYTATSVSVTALGAPFAIANNTCGTSVAAAASCTFDVTFTPTVTGAAIDTATVPYANGAASTSATLGLSATGVNTGSLAITVADPSNKIATYTCAPVTVSAKDPGGSPLAVTSSISITLTGLGAGLAYGNLSDCRAATSSISTLFLSVGQDHKDFYYRTATAESLTFQAQATDFDTGSLGVTTVVFQVLGQSNGTAYQQTGKGMNNPQAVYSNGTLLYVADTSNNRVLGWTTLPTSSGQAADFVLGQTDLVTFTSGTSAVKMTAPNAVHGDGTRLFVSDMSNNRVLVWNALPTTTGQAANFALGQTNLTNNTFGYTSTTMSFPTGVCSDGTRVFVVDGANSRVLVWSSMPSSNGAAASFALGQADLNSQGGNAGASGLNGPNGIFCDGTRVFVGDSGNNRVLVWSALPTTSGQAANFVLGQPDFTSITNGLGASSMYSPRGIYSDGTKLYVADYGNQRVLVWNTLPTTTAQAASFALGQADLTSGIAGLSASKLWNPSRVYGVGTKLFVADASNNRVVIWNTLPTSSGQAADLALGQPDLITGSQNVGVSLASSMSAPYGLHSDGTRLFVADTANNRVLVWNTLPTTDGQSPNLVLGQPDFTTGTANTGGVSGSSLSAPQRPFSDGTRLFVADRGNNRVLVWNTIPTTNGQSASFALGQPDLTSSTANNGGRSGSTISAAQAVYSDGTRLFVADWFNHRVLVWNTIPTSNGQSASFALGQPDLSSGTGNNGGLTGSSLFFPNGVYSDGTRVFVSDQNNNRVLGWSSMPTSSGQSASFALGQPGLTTGTFNNGGLLATALSGPSGVTGDGTRLFVGDTGNHRVLGWTTLPTGNAQAADFVIGQPGFTTGTLNNGGLSATSIYRAQGVFSDGVRAFIADTGNSRVTVVPLP